MAKVKARLFDDENITDVPAEVKTPSIPGALAALAAAMAAIPDGENLAHRRALPVRMYHEALRDIGIWSNHCLRNRGLFGLDLRGAVWCAQARWLRVLQFGRLQCNDEYIYRGEPWRAAGLDDGAPVINLHIPESGPMTPRACRASMRRMRSFFDRYRAGYEWQGGFCHSWLLDPALREVCDPKSNILAFQKLGICEVDEKVDSDIVFRVFGEKGIAAVRQPNAFQRRVIAALERGVRFHMGKLFIPRADFGR